MRVLCVKCNEIITEATFEDVGEDGNKLTVFHHGEEDCMYFPRGWSEQDPQFWMLIASGFVLGRAFVEKEDSKV